MDWEYGILFLLGFRVSWIIILPVFMVFLFYLHQVISWRGRRKAPPDGQNSTLMYMNQLHMRPRGWLKVFCMRWGCLLSTALACLRQVSALNPSCLLVRMLSPSFSAFSPSQPRYSLESFCFCHLQPQLVSQHVCRCMMWQTAHAPWSGSPQRRLELGVWMAILLNTARKEVILQKTWQFNNTINYKDIYLIAEVRPNTRINVYNTITTKIYVIREQKHSK